MVIARSAGLQELLNSDAAYAKQYADVVQEVSTSVFKKLKHRYEGEFSSWRNRKTWAKRHHCAWDVSLDSFKEFLCGCGPKPQSDYTLDRIDHEGQYLLHNLRWASKEVQNNNKGNNVRICVGQEMLTIFEVATRSGKTYDAVRMGIVRHGPTWAENLVANASPTFAAEVAWQFPELLRDELETLYKERRDATQSRVRFFLKIALAQYREHAFYHSISRNKSAEHHKEVANKIADYHNAAGRFLDRCDPRRRRHAEDD